MMDYDVIIIHPPAIYDFRKKPLFPGALAPTAERIQFTKVPIGMLSIADYLDRHGYKVLVDNLADRMVYNKDLDAEEHLGNLSSRIYAIGLHFQQHSQGAIEVARLCKKLHPDSLVIIGGLTATIFHEEIIQKYEFIDAVIRGEAEMPFLQLVKAFEKYGKLTETSNITYRADSGEVRLTPLMKPINDLDEFEFTRLDLLEPKTSIFNPDEKPRWSLEVCRGCIYNCTICGGSAYTYNTYLGRCRPAFRSPKKIVRDIQYLNEHGIRFIGLYQDPRMGGGKYWKELMAALRNGKLDIDRLTIDIFNLVNEEFVREVATIGNQVIFHICPDSGACKVRRAQGRFYSNEDLINTAKLCHKYHIPVTFFFSVGMAGENLNTINDTWELWDKLCSLDQAALTKGSFGHIRDEAPVGGPIIGPISIDPGSIAFDFPEEHGYKLRLRNLEEYVGAFSKPSWHQWINYETDLLNRDQLIELIFKSIEYSIKKGKEYGLYNELGLHIALTKAIIDLIACAEVNYIMTLMDIEERESRLNSLREAVDSFPHSPHNSCDPYGYKEMIWKISGH